MTRRRDGAAIVGIGAAACAACCIGPILGVLAAIGLTTVAGVVLFGAAGLLVALLALVVVVRRRRRSTRAGCGTPPSDPIRVDLRTVRSSTSA